MKMTDMEQIRARRETSLTLGGSLAISYLLILLILEYSKKHHVPFVSGEPSVGWLMFLSSLNLFAGLFSVVVLMRVSGSLVTSEDVPSPALAGVFKWIYVVCVIGLTTLAIYSLYELINMTGGIYLSPFTGFYSLLISILVLCRSKWRSNHPPAWFFALVATGATAGSIFFACRTDARTPVFRFEIEKIEKPLDTADALSSWGTAGQMLSSNRDARSRSHGFQFHPEDSTISLTGHCTEEEEARAKKSLSDIASRCVFEHDTFLKVQVGVGSLCARSRLVEGDEPAYTLAFVLCISLSVALFIDWSRDGVSLLPPRLRAWLGIKKVDSNSQE